MSDYRFQKRRKSVIVKMLYHCTVQNGPLKLTHRNKTKETFRMEKKTILK